MGGSNEMGGGGGEVGGSNEMDGGGVEIVIVVAVRW